MKRMHPDSQEEWSGWLSLIIDKGIASYRE
jgi:hypothetical protein